MKKNSSQTVTQPEIKILYVTHPSQKDAESLAESLVSEGLVSCVNIIPQVKSIYQWNGQLEKSDEVVLILKMKASAFIYAKERIEQLHPYETVCLLELHVNSLNESYLNWLISDRN